MLVCVCAFLFSSNSLKAQTVNNAFVLARLSRSEVGPSMKIVRRLQGGQVIVAMPDSSASHEPDSFLNWRFKNLAASAKEDRVLFVSSLAPERTMQRLHELNYSYQKYSNTLWAVELDAAAIPGLLEWEELSYIGYEAYRNSTEAVVLDLNLNPNGFNLMKQEFPAIRGAGLHLSIQELRFREDDIDLLGRTVYPDLADTRSSTHATQMATIIGGAGNSLITGLGVLPEVTLVSSGFDEPLPDPTPHYQDLNIHVQNHSYGTAIESFYGAYAQLFDQSAQENPALLHVFSSGNSGREVAEEGTYAGLTGYGNLTGNYKMAKNAIVVGAVDTVGRINTQVSNGPAYDGRVKPEVVAYSTSGSSNAAAMVSGLTGAMQALYEALYGEVPSAALVKSVLINAADDVGRRQVDFRTGFGNVDTAGSMRTIRDDRMIRDTLSGGETREHLLTIPANARDLKVTMVWNDPAANPGDEVALVNDLDLKLIDGAGQVFLPWVLHTSPSLPDLERLATRGEDHLNNVEQVTIADVQGPVTLQVSSTFQLTDQSYAIAYEWQLKDQFEWRYPLSSDNMPYNGETDGYFRWHSTFDAGDAELEISYDGGANWELIDQEVDLSRGYYRWSAPDTLSKAKARMRFRDQLFETATFTIGQILRPSVGFDCGDSLLLQWPGAAAAPAYRLYELGETSFDQVGEQEDTLVVINKADINSGIYAVQPILADDRPVLRSEAFDINQLAGGCYFSSFFSEVIPEEGIGLNVQLGSGYQVEEVLFQRSIDGAFATLGAAMPSPEFTMFLDETPHQGYNLHRIGITFEDGRMIFSDSITTYFLTDKKLLVFPNPISAGSTLNVFTRLFEAADAPVFELVDAKGKVYVRQAIIQENERIDLDSLQPGLYFYRVSGLGRDVGGRVVIR